MTALKRGPRGNGSERSQGIPSSANDADIAGLAELRLLMRVCEVEVYDPRPAINQALELAKKVRAVSNPRFTGAEIDLVTVREINAITEAAERAVNNLQTALDYLESQ